MKKISFIMAALFGVTTVLTASAAGFPEHVYAPTVNVATQKGFDFNKAIKKSGQKIYKLTGLTVNPEFKKSSTEVFLDGKKLMDTVSTIRKSGGDVIFSFDDDSNPPSVDEAAYQKVIDCYKIKWIDFKIDRSVLHWCVGCKWELDSILKVMKNLQDNNSGLIVSLTTNYNDKSPSDFTEKENDTFLNYILLVNKDIGADFATINIQVPFSKAIPESTLDVTLQRYMKLLEAAYNSKGSTEIRKMISITPRLNNQSEFVPGKAKAVVTASTKAGSKFLSLVFENPDDFYKYTNIFKSFSGK
ncbi:MAG: hypothetical protein GY750_19690 [Lentisphaerae bacterium]|nr:hypothetical protein [Lentisphaerota bacterium]MCP4103621.1 hypothetical protein [Lentisphaerota bacterium]